MNPGCRSHRDEGKQKKRKRLFNEYLQSCSAIFLNYYRCALIKPGTGELIEELCNLISALHQGMQDGDFYVTRFSESGNLIKRLSFLLIVLIEALLNNSEAARIF